MSDAQSDAARRAAARKAKILARGNSGLAKLAQTARGEEAEKLYGGSESSTPRSPPFPAPRPTAPSTEPSWTPPPSSSSAQPPDQQAMSDQLQSLMSMFAPPSGASSSAAGPQGMPDMQALFAQMMGVDAPPLPGSGQNLLGDLDDPAGLGGGGNLPPGFSAFPGLGGDGMMPPGFGMGGPRPRGKVDKWWGLVHVLAVLSLVVLALGWWEPSLHAARGARGVVVGGKWAGRWSQLVGERGGLLRTWMTNALPGQVEVLPIFWAFTTLELILQTTRFFLLKSPPPPHSLIQNFLPLMPPAIARPLVTGSRYLTLLSQTYKDGCLLIFVIGIAVLVSGYLQGGSGSITIQGL